jgi:hypothetical protein
MHSNKHASHTRKTRQSRVSGQILLPRHVTNPPTTLGNSLNNFCFFYTNQFAIRIGAFSPLAHSLGNLVLHVSPSLFVRFSNFFAFIEALYAC